MSDFVKQALIASGNALLKSPKIKPGNTQTRPTTLPQAEQDRLTESSKTPEKAEAKPAVKPAENDWLSSFVKGIDPTKLVQGGDPISDTIRAGAQGVGNTFGAVGNAVNGTFGSIGDINTAVKNNKPDDMLNVYKNVGQGIFGTPLKMMGDTFDAAKQAGGNVWNSATEKGKDGLSTIDKIVSAPGNTAKYMMEATQEQPKGSDKEWLKGIYDSLGKASSNGDFERIAAGIAAKDNPELGTAYNARAAEKGKDFAAKDLAKQTAASKGTLQETAYEKQVGKNRANAEMGLRKATADWENIQPTFERAEYLSKHTLNDDVSRIALSAKKHPIIPGSTPKLSEEEANALELENILSNQVLETLRPQLGAQFTQIEGEWKKQMAGLNSNVESERLAALKGLKNIYRNALATASGAAGQPTPNMNSDDIEEYTIVSEE